jgi:hypothetical protein
VSVQYGADQPVYDLIVAKADYLRKISVKGSKDRGWGLTQSYLNGADYHAAIDAWISRHDESILFCFAQFSGVELGECPRVYLAQPQEVAAALHSLRGGQGDTVLREAYTYSRGIGAGTTDSVPPTWRFSEARIDALFNR